MAITVRSFKRAGKIVKAFSRKGTKKKLPLKPNERKFNRLERSTTKRTPSKKQLNSSRVSSEKNLLTKVIDQSFDGPQTRKMLGIKSPKTKVSLALRMNRSLSKKDLDRYRKTPDYDVDIAELKRQKFRLAKASQAMSYKKASDILKNVRRDSLFE